MRVRGELYPTVEHLYQTLKTFEFGQREEIMRATTPGKAKRLGQKVDLRADWEEIKEAEMLKSVRLKFKLNPDLRRRLLLTGVAKLVEGNHWHDNIWGNCYCSKCKELPGKNLLGKILMLEERNVKNYEESGYYAIRVCTQHS